MKNAGHPQPSLAGRRRNHIPITDAGRTELRDGAAQWNDLQRAITAV